MLPGFEDYSETIQKMQNKHWPVIGLLSLALPRLVEGRCLCIDADTLVMGDVWELLNADMGGKPLGACESLVDDPRMISFGFEPGENHFNAGVLVMDCDLVRERFDWESLTSLDVLRLYPIMSDQCRLNQFFQDQWYRLPMKWNVYTCLQRYHSPLGCLSLSKWRKKIRFASDRRRQAIREAVEDPRIWHFTGRWKPWNSRYGNSRFRLIKYQFRLMKHKGWRDYRQTLTEFNDLMESGR